MPETRPSSRCDLCLSVPPAMLRQLHTVYSKSEDQPGQVPRARRTRVLVREIILGKISDTDAPMSGSEVRYGVQRNPYIQSFVSACPLDGVFVSSRALWKRYLFAAEARSVSVGYIPKTREVTAIFIFFGKRRAEDPKTRRRPYISSHSLGAPYLTLEPLQCAIQYQFMLLFLLRYSCQSAGIEERVAYSYGGVLHTACVRWDINRQQPRPNISQRSSRFCFLSLALSSFCFESATFALSTNDRERSATAASGL